MIKSISIKNIALIDELEIDFSQGLNILTGETGAGKSIILGSLALILGEKGSAEVVRSGCEKGRIEVNFDISGNAPLNQLLLDSGIEADDELILVREITVDGKSKCYANLSSIPVSGLKSFGEYLIDISGQHQHESLLRTKLHIELLDRFASLENDVKEFAGFFSKYEQTQKEYNTILENEKDREQRLELASFAKDEIERAELLPGEDEELASELKSLDNYEKLITALENSYAGIYDAEPSVITMLETVIGLLDDVKDFHNLLPDAVSEANESLFKLENVKDTVRSIINEMDYSQERHEEVRERLDLIRNLKKKYGNTIDEISEYAVRCEKQVQELMASEQNKEKLEAKIDVLQKKISALALELSKKRQQSAIGLQELIIKELSYLGMENSRFIVDFRYVHNPDSFLRISDKGVKIESNGIDRVEFLFSANLGEQPLSLAKIASGGELSRVMLAIKTILSSEEHIGTLVFDEVDVGISGEVANKVGRKIKTIAENKQVLCITHSPQIASMGNKNYQVLKEVKDDRTITKIAALNNDEKIHELARMLGGENITEATLKHAQELINKT